MTGDGGLLSFRGEAASSPDAGGTAVGGTPPTTAHAPGAPSPGQPREPAAESGPFQYARLVTVDSSGRARAAGLSPGRWAGQAAGPGLLRLRRAPASSGADLRVDQTGRLWLPRRWLRWLAVSSDPGSRRILLLADEPPMQVLVVAGWLLREWAAGGGRR